MICDSNNAGVGNLSNFLYSYLLVLEKTLFIVVCSPDSNLINFITDLSISIRLEKYPATATNSSSRHGCLYIKGNLPKEDSDKWSTLAAAILNSPACGESN